VAPACFQAGIECLQRVLTKELPAEVGDLAKSYVDAALGQFDGQAAEACCRLSPETQAGQLASRYLLAVLEGDRRKAREIVLEVDPKRMSILELYLEVILPAQEEIGRMWLANEITVAEEHFATATTRSVMAQLLAKAPVRQSNGKTVMTAAVAGNRHDIGIQTVCDFFEMDGWKAIQLGADVPVGDLVEAIEHFHVDLLALSRRLRPIYRNCERRSSRAQLRPGGGYQDPRRRPGVWRAAPTTAMPIQLGASMPYAAGTPGSG
jgi:methanogenic corrinoid protein MtbC1